MDILSVMVPNNFQNCLFNYLFAYLIPVSNTLEDKLNHLKILIIDLLHLLTLKKLSFNKI